VPRQNLSVSTVTIPPILAFCVALAVLYFGRRILIPLALALLLAFLLSPVAKLLESRRIPRVPAALTVLFVTFGALGGVSYAVTDQLLDIMSDLPRYRENIHQKLAAVREPPGALRQLLSSVEELGKELTITAPTQPSPAAPRKPARSARNGAPAVEDRDQPLKVEVVQPPPSALQSLRNFLGPLLGPVETTILVIVFTVFMLIDRDDLRNRLLGLIGQRQLNVTTKAMDDAAKRVSRYLQVQFLVNAAFGATLALGLFFIGIPSALLWGVLAMLLRFIPYVGTVISGTSLFLLTVATTVGWRSPFLVMGLFIAIEIVTSNFVEPKVYGSRTGLSAVAVLAAAVFWAALWGPVGLILSTPLTVCLSVLGKYSPHLQFLDILLGDQPVLPPDALFYQRLLALDQQDALSIAEGFLKERSLIELYDSVIIPALAMAERDRHGGTLEAKREEFIVQSINECVTELTESEQPAPARGGKRNPPAPATAVTQKSNRIFCISAHDMADEIAAAMLAQVAGRHGYPTLAFPVTDAPVELLDGLGPQNGDVVCISSVPPLALTHARSVSKAVRERFPDVSLVVGLWNYETNNSRTFERLEQSSSSRVVTTLAAAMDQIRSAAQNPL
jgi:predicted PurR-regulated permease PerM